MKWTLSFSIEFEKSFTKFNLNSFGDHAQIVQYKIHSKKKGNKNAINRCKSVAIDNKNKCMFVFSTHVKAEEKKKETQQTEAAIMTSIQIRAYLILKSCSQPKDCMNHRIF